MSSDSPDTELTHGLFQDDQAGEHEESTEANEFAVERLGRKRPLAPHSRDFDVLAIILKFVGVSTTLTALLVLLAGAQLAAVALAAGIVLVATGYGLAAYKTWAWYSAVAVMPVLVVVFSITSVVEVATNRLGSFFVGFPFVFSFYVAWVLLSKGGRARYRAAGEAIAKAKANPDSVAGQLYLRRRR